MFSAQQIKNFIPQNPKLNAPRRIDVKPPIYQPTITNYNDGYPLASQMNGGLRYESTTLAPMRNASSLNQYDAMYPCIPQASATRVLKPEPLKDTVGFQPPFGKARNEPKGIASQRKRDALFAYECPAEMYTQTQLAPEMPLYAFR